MLPPSWMSSCSAQSNTLRPSRSSELISSTKRLRTSSALAPDPTISLTQNKSEYLVEQSHTTKYFRDRSHPQGQDCLRVCEVSQRVQRTQCNIDCTVFPWTR